MRLKILLSANTSPIPYNYNSKIAGYVNKVIGDNNIYHDKLSLYSVSELHHPNQSIGDENGINLKRGAYFYVSSPSREFISDFIKNVYNHTEVFCGMYVKKVELVNLELRKIAENTYYYYVQSPVLLKFRTPEKTNYYTYETKEHIDFLKQILLKKLNALNIDHNPDDIQISFDVNYPNKRIKPRIINGAKHQASMCPIILKTTNPEIPALLYDIGAGHSTGCGLGFLY